MKDVQVKLGLGMFKHRTVMRLLSAIKHLKGTNVLKKPVQYVDE